MRRFLQWIIRGWYRRFHKSRVFTVTFLEPHGFRFGQCVITSEKEIWMYLGNGYFLYPKKQKYIQK